MKNKLRLYTIGHSNREIGQFTDLLKAHKIKKVVDIRTIPKSRHNPQFNQDKLRKSLQKIHIHYEHIKALGGFRHAKKDSVNLGWRNVSFRRFADYMQTQEFLRGLNQLKRIALKKNTAIMCAEAVPWRCHRSLVADALVKQKWQVLHIQSRKTASPHRLTSFLRMRAGKLTYPKKRSEVSNKID